MTCGSAPGATPGARLLSSRVHDRHPRTGDHRISPANCGMTDVRGDRHGQAPAPGRAPAASVLAERMAAALLHHEPGWRLPRHTALARRYNVTTAEIDAAIELLAARHLLTRLPDGQIFRASPAEYRVALEGLPGFAAQRRPDGGRAGLQEPERVQAAARGRRRAGAGRVARLRRAHDPLPVDGGRRARRLLGQLPAAGRWKGWPGNWPARRRLPRRRRGTPAPVPSRWTSSRPPRRWPAACGCPPGSRPPP